MGIPQIDKLWDNDTYNNLFEGVILRADDSVKKIALGAPVAELFVTDKLNIVALRCNKLLLNIENVDHWVGKYVYDLFLLKERRRIEKYFSSCKENNVYILNNIRLKKIFANYKHDVILSVKMVLRDNVIEGYLLFFHPQEAIKMDDTSDSYFVKTYEDDMDELGLFLRDDIAQNLFAVRVMLQKFIIDHGYDHEIKAVKSSLNETINKLLVTSDKLRPNVLLDFGILKALENVIAHWKDMGLLIRYSLEHRIQLESAEMQRCLYRIVQLIFEYWSYNKLSTNLWLSIRHKVSTLYILAEHTKVKNDQDCMAMSSSMMTNIQNRIALFSGNVETCNTVQSCQVKIKMNSSTKKI